MKQDIRKGLKDIIVDEVPDPVLLPHHVLVRPLYSLISSGTETASIHRDSLISEVADNPSHLRKIWDVAMKTGPVATLAEVRAKFGCANTWPALSDGSAGSLEQALPTLISSGEYRTASKLYFQLATERSRLKETAAACTALSQSLAYYRKAIAKDTGAQLEEAATDGNSDEGLAEVRSKFGCASI